MRLQVGCTLSFTVAARTAIILNVEAMRTGYQRVERETLTLRPALDVDRFTPPETGSPYARVVLDGGTLQVEYRADLVLSPRLHDPAAVEEIEPAALPLAVLNHLLPSRFCPSDTLQSFARRQFGDLPPGHRRVAAVCAWVHGHLEYKPGASNAETTAADVLLARCGVCRDFAHLTIALLRALNIPARYVSAYAWRLNPPDFHAVVEAYLRGPDGPAWYVFDPTGLSNPAGIARIGVGRDAAEVSFATVLDAAESPPPQVHADGPDTPPDGGAVSLSGD